MSVEILPQELLEHMTKAELAAYREHIQREMALDGLFAYMRHVTPAVRDFPHQILLCDWIDALLDGRLYADGPGPHPVRDEDGVMRHPDPDRADPVLYQLAIYEPPRHGKSFSVSDHLPAYAMTKYPWLKTHFATYEADFAKYWSGKVLDHLTAKDHADFFGVRVKNGAQAAKESWAIEGNGGEYKCAGVGGPITGRGRHLGIADDLIKNAEEANSAAVRSKIKDWWTTTWWTRRQKWPDGTPCREILMNTRWHADDISANVVGDSWAVLSLPAIAEDDAERPDLLARLPGEPLCESIMTADDLAVLDSDDTNAGGMGRQWFAALYQQRPYIQGGNLIHDPFNHATFDGGNYFLKLERSGGQAGEILVVKEADCFRFGMLDLAASEKTTADFTVLGIFDVTPTTPRRIILRHLYKARIGTDLHESLVVDLYRPWKLRFIGIEDKTFGTNLINTLRRKGGINIRSIKADKDKVQRAMPLDGHVKNEMLWWMADQAWTQGLEEEVLQFPNARHDDQVDVLAYAARIFEAMPQVRRIKHEPVTMDEKVAARIADLRKPRKRTQMHPQLGRL